MSTSEEKENTASSLAMNEKAPLSEKSRKELLEEYLKLKAEKKFILNYF